MLLTTFPRGRNRGTFEGVVVGDSRPAHDSGSSIKNLIPLLELNRFGGVNNSIRDRCVVNLSLEYCVFAADLPDLDQVAVAVEHEPDLREIFEGFFVAVVELCCACDVAPGFCDDDLEEFIHPRILIRCLLSWYAYMTSPVILLSCCFNAVEVAASSSALI